MHAKEKKTNFKYINKGHFVHGGRTVAILKESESKTSVFRTEEFFVSRVASLLRPAGGDPRVGDGLV